MAAAGYVLASTPELQVLPLSDERVLAALRETIERDPLVSSVTGTKYVGTFLVVTHSAYGLKMLHGQTLTVAILGVGPDNEVYTTLVTVKLEVA